MRLPQLLAYREKLIVRRLTQNEQRELQNRMEKKQMKEFMNVREHLLQLCNRCSHF